MGSVGLDDCTVPEQQDDSSLSTSLEEMNSTSYIHLNTVQLTMSPVLMGESHSGLLETADVPSMHMLSPMSTSPMNVSPSTSDTELLTSYVHTAFPPHAHAQRPRPASNENPFSQFYSSMPSQNNMFNTSPTHSGNTSNSPINANPGNHTLSSNLTCSYPQTLIYHRYPLTLSLSTDSYFSNSSGNSVEDRPARRHAISHSSPVSSSPFLSPNVSLLHRNFQHSVVNNQNDVDSLVTVWTSNHSLAGASVTICSTRSGQGHGRHSFSEGDRPNPRLLIPSQTHSQTQRRRRNSSGCEQSVHQSTAFTTNRSGSSLRHRRRSHDARAEQGELLACLNAVASRRRRSHSSPFQVPVQVHYSTPTGQESTTAH